MTRTLCGRRAEANGHPPSGGPGGDDAASPSRSANGAAGDAEPWHACLDNHSYSRGGSREHSLSLQKSSISASSLRTESAHSLVNNESLGLDERAVFESFNKAGLHARRCAIQSPTQKSHVLAGGGFVAVSTRVTRKPLLLPGISCSGTGKKQAA